MSKTRYFYFKMTEFGLKYVYWDYLIRLVNVFLACCTRSAALMFNFISLQIITNSTLISITKQHVLTLLIHVYNTCLL